MQCSAPVSSSTIVSGKFLQCGGEAAAAAVVERRRASEILMSKITGSGSRDDSGREGCRDRYRLNPAKVKEGGGVVKSH